MNGFFARVISHPVAVTLLTLGVILLGATAFRLLPVAPLPQVDIPTIFVSASMPGASPETMASTVATPLERALGGIAGITEMTSSSSLGSSQIVIQFDLSRNIDSAAREVQAAINAAVTMLPSGLPRAPTYRKANPANAPIINLALTSDTLSSGQLYDIAATVLAQRLSQIEGVGDVTVSGASLPAVRVELNTAQLEQYGISADIVRRKISSSNANRPKGMIEYGDTQWLVGANDQASSAESYKNLIVHYKNGAPVRLTDVADVIDSVQDIYNAGMFNGKPAVHLVCRGQAGANIIETVDRIRALMPVLKASLPEAVDLTITMDRTPTIRASLREVERALLVSIALVVLMVFIFLRNARATLIPSIAVPVSLLGSAVAMYLLGFSLNNISLMALTIATGFVVDDAIVVLENIARHREMGKSSFKAAVDGVREVGFTVVSMSVSLITVFIPIILMRGLVGRFFHEFAMTLAVAVTISMVVALTAVPMLAARLLPPHQKDIKQNAISRAIENFLTAARATYAETLTWVIHHRRFMLLVFFGILGLNIYIYMVIPKGFLPMQDTGQVMAFMRADQSISFQAMKPKYEKIMKIVESDPAVKTVTGFTGGRQRNSGSMFIVLKPLEERRASAQQIVMRLQRALAKESGIRLFMMPLQDLRVGGREANAEFQYTLQSDDMTELNAWVPRLRRALAELPEITDVNTDDDDRGAQTMITLNRDQIARLGLTVNEIDTALNNAYGQRQVSTIYNTRNQYRVVMEAAEPYRKGPENLQSLMIVRSDGERVPLSSVATFSSEPRALSVRHQGQFTATTIAFNLANGVSLSEAMESIQYAVLKAGMPVSIMGTFQGTARVFQDTMRDQIILILGALLALYIVLGILYESYTDSLVIISSLPSAGIGALLGLMVCHTEFSLIALLGVLLLIGLVMKNAIMMVDFAVTRERDEGLSPKDAIYQAALLRFRPILMTSMTAMLAAVPLALGAGDGAELRKPLGIAIIGGLIVSQFLTLYTTPVVYLAISKLKKRAKENAPRSTLDTQASPS